jgi:hypothetical protein
MIELATLRDSLKYYLSKGPNETSPEEIDELLKLVGFVLWR